MSVNTLKSVYKYCSVYDITDFDKDSKECNENPLKNLFNCVQCFSSRTRFNDLFDTQFRLVIPSKVECKRLYHNSVLKGRFKRDFKSKYVERYDHFIKQVPHMTKELWDSYRIYCVTTNPTSNLMWGHYANCHKGFCIEWDATMMKTTKIDYLESLPKFNFLDFMKSQYGLMPKLEVESIIEELFKTKLIEWKYEEEHRLIITDSKPIARQDFDDFSLIKFEPSWVKSVIFGCKMPEETKRFIAESIPYHVRFKEAYIDPVSESTISLRDYN
jgi:hypothetical protein